MTDRLTNIVLGLQRLTEETQIRGKDIRHAQEQEDAEHLKYLNELLVMVQKMHSALIEDIREFSPRPVIQQVPTHQLNQNTSKPPTDPTMPKFLQQGPRKEAQ